MPVSGGRCNGLLRVARKLRRQQRFMAQQPLQTGQLATSSPACPTYSHSICPRRQQRRPKSTWEKAAGVKARSRLVRIVLLGVFSILGILLTYGEVRGVFSPAVAATLPLVYVGVLFVYLRRSGVIRPREANRPPSGGRARAADFAKSAGCMLASLVWAAAAVQFLSDTAVGIVIMAVPLFLILGTGAFFFWRGLSGQSR
jgi:hypothetical protein